MIVINYNINKIRDPEFVVFKVLSHIDCVKFKEFMLLHVTDSNM